MHGGGRHHSQVSCLRAVGAAVDEREWIHASDRTPDLSDRYLLATNA